MLDFSVMSFTDSMRNRRVTTTPTRLCFMQCASDSASKHLCFRTREHSVAAAAAIRDEEELYSDVESGNDDRVDRVNPARESWRSAQRLHGGSRDFSPQPRVQVCGKSLQWSSTVGSLRPDGFDSWA